MNAWYSLTGKKVWITGGAGHLGTPITTALDEAGAKVLCFDLDGRAENLVRERKLTRTTGITCDLSDATALPGVIDDAIARHGLPDGLAQLAFASSAGKRLEQLLPSEFQRTFDLALTPTFLLCRALAEKMKVRGSGSMVLFSSMYGMVAPDPRIYRDPLTPNPIDYGASKAAILQLSRYFAAHYGPAGVRFNCVTPGPFPNPATQKSQPDFVDELSRKTMLNRSGQNTEIVGPTLFLLGDGASYVTGHSLVVDGGWTAW
ncbi:MAG: SDR family oxidoreductase [Opitutaceae bacterium]|nr:SDR family oxidoreductase [Opitutaceae bacterium]